MPEVMMRARDVLAAQEVIGRLLIIHSPLPAASDEGRSARAGVRLRRAKRAVAEAVEGIQADMDEAREEAKRQALGGDARALAEMQQRISEAGAIILNSPVTLTLPELLTREDWDAIPSSAPHIMPNLDEQGRPQTVTLRKTEADLDALGPLVSDADEVG